MGGLANRWEARMKDLYINYLEHKLGFTEKLLLSFIDIYNKGGTLPVFQSFEEWKGIHNVSQSNVEADAGKPSDSGDAYIRTNCGILDETCADCDEKDCAIVNQRS